MKTKLKIEGKSYELDIHAAIAHGVLSAVHEVKDGPLQVGDTFQGGGRNPLLLVQAVYNDPNSYQLLGLGASTNSDDFYQELHSMEEIEKYLYNGRMTFVKNVNNQIRSIIKP